MRAMVLCSGGIKSAFLTFEAAKEGETCLLFINHAQPQVQQEWEAVKYLSKACRSPLIRLNLDGFPTMDQPLLRLLCFFARALPLLRELRCYKLYYGLSRDELPFSIDISTAEEFIVSLQHLLEISLPHYTEEGLWLGNIEMDTPLRRLQLKHVIRLGNEHHISWENTWSCEKDGDLHCGVCTKCLQRKRAFYIEGTEDPTRYLE